MGGRRAVPADPAAAPMLSLEASAMERLNHELCAQRDRFIRYQSVQNDMLLDLPTSIPLPDGEEFPYGSSTRMQIRDPQQEAEIYQKCIRPPPNRTIFDGDSPPPYRASIGIHSNSKSHKKSSDLFDRTVRCFGMKRNEEPSPPPSPPPPPPPLPAVLVPCNRSRKLAAFSENAPKADIASVPTVSCAVPPSYMGGPQPRQVVPEAYPGDQLRSHSSGMATGSTSSIGTASASGKSSGGASGKSTRGASGKSTRGASGKSSGGASGKATGGASGKAAGGTSGISTGGASSMATGGTSTMGGGGGMTLQVGYAPSFAPCTSGFGIGYPPGFAASGYTHTYVPGFATARASELLLGPSGSGSNDGRAAKGKEKKSEKTSV